MAGGRPTKYDPIKTIEQAREYLDFFKPSITQEERTKADIDEILPTKEGLAIFLGVHRDTIYDWSKGEEADDEGNLTADDKPEFSDIVDELMSRQAVSLFNKGLMGVYNPTMAKLGLTKHGYSDRMDSKVDNEGSITIIEAEYV